MSEDVRKVINRLRTANDAKTRRHFVCNESEKLLTAQANKPANAVNKSPVNTKPANNANDRKAYMREYLRRRRAANHTLPISG
jgi:hypothetical protein